MKYFLFFTALFLMYLTSFAQYENFDLSNYKLPGIKRHQLDFDFYTFGHNRSSYYIFDSAEDKAQTNSNKFQGNSDMNYAYYRNSAKFQTKINAKSLLRYFKVDKSGDFASEEDYSQFASHFFLDYDMNYFPNQTTWFLTFHPDGELGYSKENNHLQDSKEKTTNFNGALGFGGGKGRIEQVQDLRHAFLLLNELEKRGVANNMLTEAEIYDLSNLISELKNKRVFDARKRKEADLIAIDSFLVANDVVNEKNDIAYFVGLEDIWDFGSLQVRESGKQIKLVITPGYRLSQIKSLNKNRLEVFDIISSLDYSIRKPISLKWQSDFDFGVNYTYTDKLKEEGITTGATKHLTRAFSNANLGFFPNTRTYLYLQGSMEAWNSSDENFFDNEKYSFNFYLGSAAYYYISERLRVGGSISYNYKLYGIFNEEIENSKLNHFQYNLKLNYAIF